MHPYRYLWLLPAVLLGVMSLLCMSIWLERRTDAVIWSVDYGASAVAFNHDGQVVASAEITGGAAQAKFPLRLRQVPDGKIIRTFATVSRPIHALAFNSDGRLLAAGGASTVWVWRVEDGKLLNTLAMPSENITPNQAVQIVFGADSQSLLVATQDGAVRVWNVHAPRLIRVLVEPKQGDFIGAVALSPDGRKLADWRDQRIVVWRADDGAELMAAPKLFKYQQANGQSGLVFSPNGEMVAALDNAQAQVWRIRDAALVATAVGHTAEIHRLAFSPDGQQLATASGEAQRLFTRPGDPTIRLWNIEDDTSAHVWRAHGNQIVALDFSPDGQYLASSAADKTIRLWQIR